MKKVVKNAREVYKTGNDIINAFKTVELEELKELQENRDKELKNSQILIG